MRTFYIFKINREFKILTLKSPYNLFMALDNIHSMNKEDLTLAVKLYDEVCLQNDVASLNLSLFKDMRESSYYMKYNNHHIINNRYTEESSTLTVNKTYLKLDCSSRYSVFFKTLKRIPNLFVVDFYSKDYFWLS